MLFAFCLDVYGRERVRDDDLRSRYSDDRVDVVRWIVIVETIGEGEGEGFIIVFLVRRER